MVVQPGFADRHDLGVLDQAGNLFPLGRIGFVAVVGVNAYGGINRLVLLGHGGRTSKEVDYLVGVSGLLAERGFDSLVIDGPGHGDRKLFEFTGRADEFAEAWALKGAVGSMLYHFYFDRSDSLVAASREWIERSLELEPRLPEGHAALGHWYYNPTALGC